MVAGMIEAGDAAGAGPLARRAVERVTAALMYMDDSAGLVGDDLRTLMAVYARARRSAPPDAGRLAGWLVSTQLDGPGWPAIELKEFAGALGPHGLAEVARLTEERGAAAEPDSWTAVWETIKDDYGTASPSVRRSRPVSRSMLPGSAAAHRRKASFIASSRCSAAARTQPACRPLVPTR